MMLSLLCPLVHAVGIRLPPPPIPGISTPRSPLSLSQIDSPRLLPLEPTFLKRTFKVDSTEIMMVGRTEILDIHFGRPFVYSLSDFRDYKLDYSFKQSWRDNIVRQLFQAQAGAGSGALEIEIPWRVKSKTFQRIFGGDRVGLRVSGDIGINGSLRRQKDEQNYTTQNDNTNYAFRIDQTQRFTIEGKVGDKVSVKVDQDSERMFDFENSIHLEYTGEEDEIIQKIEAGNVSLNLTGTQLATFSGKSTGLFGLKTESKVGPLSLTTIASIEKGQKNKKSLTGGAEEQAITIQSTNYIRNKYFFLDEYYTNNYRKFSTDLQHIAVPQDSQIFTAQVFKRVTQTTGGSVKGVAVVNPNDPDTTQSSFSGYFRKLDPSTGEYYLENLLGTIRLKYPLNDSDILAVSYLTKNSTMVGDTLIPNMMEGYVFKLIRPENPLPADPTWDLEMKNVYNLQATNIQEEGFEVSVKYSSGQAANDPETQMVNGVNQTYLTILGLDTRDQSGAVNPDGVIDYQYHSLVDMYNGELILPGLRPFDPDPVKGGGYYIGSDFIIPAIDSNTWNNSIYDSLDDDLFPSKYYFNVKYKNLSASYSLGFGVLEGSEEVYLNGQRLQKNKDYTIDYMTGNLIITNEAAASPSADVDVLWESGEIFQLDKKTLLGVRGEYDLWNEESFIGATALYLNEKPLEERVKVGNEPTRNFILDANTRMVMRPQFITTALDYLPLLEAEAPSEINFEGEIARVYPNPNSLNNSGTGDNDGVAYLDDFESVKRTTTLGIMRRNWTIGSPPKIGGIAADIGKKGKLLWYNPWQQVPIQEIWPEREVNSKVASNVHILTLEFTPDSALIDPQDSWASIQRYMGAGFADQSKSKFLEIWVKVSGKADPGYMHIDMGEISEDAIPNGILNNEDKNLPELPYGNYILDNDEDIGLDLMANNDPRAQAAKVLWESTFPDRDEWDFWDINDDSVRGENEPWSDDDYSYTAKGSVEHINGTEGNMYDEGERRPDSEDLNSNSILDKSENFFRCSVNLSNVISGMDTLIAGEGGNNWKLIRFPLKYAEQIGSPAWSQIKFIRLWMDGATEETTVQIAQFELVGNEWEEVIQSDAAGVPRERLEIAVINTYDNPDYANDQPPGVSGVRDPITGILSKEQSLVLKITEMPPRSTAMIHKTYYNRMSFLEYNTLKMFVHGGGGNTLSFLNYDMDMFFRFGADTSSNYYEIYQKLKPGWDVDNEIRIDLDAIPQIKRDRKAIMAGITVDTGTKVDSIQTSATTWKYYAYRIADSDSLVVMGNPSMSQIQQLTVGLRNMSKRTITTEDQIEVWLDELRLSDVKKDPGTAYRATATIKLSDFGRVSGELSETDADFHNLSQRIGSNQMSARQRINGNFNLDKFLSPTWGLRIPVNASFQRDTKVPKYYTNSDILVDQGDQDAVDTVKTLTESFGWDVSFAKSTKSTNPFIRYTIDDITTSYNFSKSSLTSPDKILNETRAHSADIRYAHTFGREKSFKIFGWTKSIPILKKLSETQFYYYPTKIDMRLSATQNETYSLTRSLVESNSGTFGLTRTFSTGYRPFNTLNFDVSRTHKSDMLGHEWNEILNGEFGTENNVNQTFTTSFAPTILSWLTHDVNYNSVYQWNWGNGYAESGKSLSSRRTISTSWNLKTSSIFGGRRGGRSGGREGRAAPSGRGGEQPKPEEGEEKKEGEETKKKFKIPNPLNAVKFFASKLNDIRFDFSHSSNLTTPAVIGHASLPYQFGFTEDPGVGQVADYAGSSISTKSVTKDFTVRSGLNLFADLRTTFDYSYKTSANYGNTRTGQVTSSRFYLVSGKDNSISDFPFVNLSVRLTGLEKLKFFKKYAQTVSLESGYSGKSTDKWNDSKENVTEITYDRGLSPLAGLNISWKGGISSSIQLKKTQQLTDRINLDQKNRSNSTTFTITGSYSRKTGFKIPIPIWPFNNKRFKNNTNFSLSFNYTARQDETLQGEADSFSITSTNTQWSLQPRLDYTFSNTVTGGIQYELGASKNNTTGKNSFQEFGFNIRIQIRGR
ncbi:cell surface protein SprA [bacterium]|nr:cell surface protein SprA [bacterium]